jgi:pyruvate dehydrogenase E2 component (dihydrolipoamide acetyltransferase)
MAVEVTMPNLGASSASSTLVRWHKAVGEPVECGAILFEAESDKATVEIEAAVSGVLSQILAQEGQVVPAGQIIAWITTGEESPARAALPPVQAEASHPHKPIPQQNTIASPLARRIAHEAGLDIRQVKGSGPRGRVVEEDVRAAIAQREALAIVQTTLETPSAVSNLTGVHLLTAQKMMDSAQNSAQVTLTAEARADKLVAARQNYRQYAAQLAEAITYDLLMAFIAARALIDHPQLNASWGSDSIILKKGINIGVAVDTERGLVVPVLKNVAARGLLDLAGELHALVERARSGRTTQADLSAGTFTITNLGLYGIDAFTPLLNLPESAILGIGRVQRRPVVEGDAIIAGYTLVLSLTFDHRVVDGAPAARFLQQVVRFVEDPALMLL